MEEKEFITFPKTKNYISFYYISGQYMPSLCLLCGAMLIRALSLWVTLQKESDEHTEKEKEEDKQEEEIIEKEELKEKEVSKEKVESNEKVESIEKEGLKEKEKLKDSTVLKKKNEVNDSELSLSVVNIGGNYLIVHLLGYAVMNSPLIFSQIGKFFLYSKNIYIKFIFFKLAL